MAFRDPIGIRFSELEGNWEVCDFRYNVSLKPDDWREEAYRRYGDLPDGRHFGAYIWPKSEAWPYTSVMMLVGIDGQMQTNAEIDGRWDVPNKYRWPQAASLSPSGKSIVWLKDGEIWAWHMDTKEKRFLPDDADSLTKRLDHVLVLDAVMGADGILLLFLKDGRKMAYLCDADLVLLPWAGAWTPIKEDIGRLKEYHDDLPESLAVIIREGDDVFDYYNCGVLRACFEPGLRTIKAGILGENPGLEDVVIPASVEQVESCAFGGCENLQKLAIEGDLSRVADWAEDAFRGCPCEESYLTLRRQALHRSRTQRAWRVPVRDAEELMHDPELFGLAGQIEASLGSRARFMLRPGGHSEIRILVEAPSEEKCLLAMLRFTRAAEKKRVLTGPAEEEEL